MEKRPCISVGQMFSMLFVSRMVVTITYGTLLIGDSDIWDHLISSVISLALTFGLILPIYKLSSMDGKMNLFDNLRDLMGKYGYIFIMVYVVYFIIITLHTLTIFDNFVSNAINPPISIPLLSIFLLLSSCYGAYKGLEALARTSTFIIVVTIISLIFLGISLFSSIETINFKPFMYSGYESVIQGTAYMVSQSSCLVALGVLIPMSRGSKIRGIIIWNLGVCISFMLIIFLVVGTMGDFVSTQLFPVYTAAGIGKFGSLQHLDSLYLGIWMSGIFLKTSLFLLLASEGIKKIWGEKIRKRFILFFSVVLSVSTLFIGNFGFLRSRFITEFLFYFLILNVVVIPAALLALKKRKLGKEEKFFET